jgi:cytoskeletal protein CcmA (bactofilin family)
MFSKPKVTNATSSTDVSSAPGFPTKPSPPPSLLSSDLTIQGNVISGGDIQIESTIEGDVRAHLLTVGESATVKGEVAADDVVINGRVVGRVRGLKVRLTATAQVEGEIIYKTMAIETGAHFEGSAQRQENPLDNSSNYPATAPARLKPDARVARPLAGEAATN